MVGLFFCPVFRFQTTRERLPNQTNNMNKFIYTKYALLCIPLILLQYSSLAQFYPNTSPKLLKSNLQSSPNLSFLLQDSFTTSAHLELVNWWGIGSLNSMHSSLWFKRDKQMTFHFTVARLFSNQAAKSAGSTALYLKLNDYTRTGIKTSFYRQNIGEIETFKEVQGGVTFSFIQVLSSKLKIAVEIEKDVSRNPNRKHPIPSVSSVYYFNKNLSAAADWNWFYERPPQPSFGFNYVDNKATAFLIHWAHNPSSLAVTYTYKLNNMRVSFHFENRIHFGLISSISFNYSHL
jgi:hypothetical protein